MCTAQSFQRDRTIVVKWVVQCLCKTRQQEFAASCVVKLSAINPRRIVAFTRIPGTGSDSKFFSTLPSVVFKCFLFNMSTIDGIVFKVISRICGAESLKPVIMGKNFFIQYVVTFSILLILQCMLVTINILQ